MNSVYTISINGKVRYIGMTNDWVRRQKEHIRGFKRVGKKDLYQMTSQLENPQIEYKVIRTFSKLGDAKKWECYLILHNYFTDRDLWQSYPRSIKYF